MKKILFFAIALAGLFLAGSCQRENLEPAGNTVTYTVQLADAVGTKALGDEISNVNVLHYEVYRTAAPQTTTFGTGDNLLYHSTADVINGEARIELELVNDQNFTVLFWAQVEKDGFVSPYTVNDLTKVKLSQSIAANNVDYAAFSGKDFIKVGDILAGRTVQLVRPISQLNIATTPESLVAFDDVIVLEGSSVKVNGLSTSFNVATQTAGEISTADFVYSETVVPTQTLKVNDVDYKYVAMNYVGFPANDGSNVTVTYVINTSEGNIDNTDAPIVNVPVKANYRTNIIGNLITSMSDYTITLDKDWADAEITIANTTEAVQAALDSATDGDIIHLEPGVNYGTLYLRPTAHNNTTMYCEAHDFTTTDAAEFKAHSADGQWHSTPKYTTTIKNLTIKGAEGATVAGFIVTSGHATSGHDYVRDIDLNNGRTYYSTIHMNNITFSNVEFTGKVDINTSDAESVYDGITFDGCTFTTGGTAEANGAAIRYYNEANNGKTRNINVNDCTFNNCRQGVYVHHVNGITITDNAFENTGHNAIGIQGHDGAVNLQKVVITGNTFNNIADRIIRFNNVGSESNIKIQNNVATNSGDENGEVIKATSIASGVVTSVKNNHWGVGKIVVNDELKDKGEFVATTAEELASLVNNATEEITVSLAADLEGKITLYQKEGVKVTIDGKNYKYTGGIQIFGNNAFLNYNMTIKNINFVAKNLDANTEACIYTADNDAQLNCRARNVAIEKCTFTGGERVVPAIRQNQGGQSENWTIKNCTIDNTMHSFLQIKNNHGYLNVEECEVKSKNGVNLNQTLNASFTSCKFNVDGYAVRVGESAATYTADGKTFTFTNCELESKNNDGDAVVIVRGTAANATLNFVNSQLIGNPTISGHENAKVYVNGVLQVANKVMHAESGLYYNGINQNHKSVFYVESAEDLRKAAAYFTGQTHSNEANYVTIELLTNIDLAGQDWTPWSVQFINLNGNNFTISNMNVPACWRGGLFGYGGPVRVNDLTIKNATVSGAQAGILIGSADGATVNNVKISGNNTVTYIPYSDGTYTETWGGIGAVTGVSNYSTINAEIVAGATVEINTNGIETDAPYVDIYTGYIQANKGTVVDNGTVKVNYSVDTPTELITALTSVKDNSTIYLTGDITVTDNWDARYSGGKTTKPIVIDGNGNTLKLTGNVTDNNHNAVFRFENAATVKNLTIDLSEAANTGQMRAMSCKSTLSVENCTFIGKSDVNSRGIIFGETATNLDFSVSIKNSEFINWKRGITDNENGKDIKSVTVENNTFTNANVNLSAYDSIVFNKNTMINSYVDLRTNTSSPTLEVTAQENTLDSAMAAKNLILNCNPSNVNAQEGFTIQ